MEWNIVIPISIYSVDDLATLCNKYLVNFGLVTSEFKRYKGVHPLVDHQFSCVRLAAPLLDTPVISRPIEFCGAISIQFCFTYLLRGASLLCRAGYIRLCHAFLVNIGLIFCYKRFNVMQ